MAGRRIGAVALAVAGGLVGYFDEGLVFAVGWVALVGGVYLAVMRWVPPAWPPAERD